MINNRFGFILILMLSISLMSFQLPVNIQKKVDKEIKLIFSIDEFLLEPIIISKEVNDQLQTKIFENDLFKIISKDKQLGYAYVGEAYGKADNFDYLVIFDNDLIIIKTKVLVYREDYGGEIGSKRWLKQFIGKGKNDHIKYAKDIIAISGATISANAMTVSVNNLLRTIAILHQNESI